MLPRGLMRPRSPLAAILFGARLLPVAAVLLSAAPAAAVDMNGVLPDTSEAHVSRTMDANGRLAAACPGSAIRAADLAIAGRVDRQSSLSAALRARAGARGSEPDPLDPSTYTFADDPDEAAAVIRGHYGPDSFITRGAETVRALANVAGRGSQVPIDGLGRLTDAIVEARPSGRRANPFTGMKLEPAVGLGEAGLNLQRRW